MFCGSDIKITSFFLNLHKNILNLCIYLYTYFIVLVELVFENKKIKK